jgi:cell division protein FtsN
MSREPEYKDKIEVSLDGRQIFYLFFGGAVIVGVVFVVGVMVGRRVEARGHTDRAHTSASADPLAALDQLESTRPPLGFKAALSGNPTPTDVDKKIETIEKARKSEPPPALDDKRGKKSDKKTDKASDAKKLDKADRTEKPDKKSAKLIEKPSDLDKKPADKPADRPTDRSTDKSIDKSIDNDKSTDKSIDKSAERGRADKAIDGEAVAEVKPDKPKPEAARFTLQLSSFQDKNEAEAFLSTMKSAGFAPYVTETQIAGKGTFYRVRMGSYRSMEAANDAKAELQKSGKTASVMRL